MSIKEHGKEYFIVPGFELFAVSHCGEVLNARTKEVMEQRISGEYKCVNALGKSWHIHRLVAIALIESTAPIEDLDVNHKDGNKFNNASKNLEWVTRSRNCVHALENGLWPSATPVLVKDLTTGEVVEYYGLNECARALKVNPALINSYLKDTSRVRLGIYAVISKGQQWPALTIDNVLEQAKGGKRVSVAISCDSNETYIFSELAQAASIIGVSAGALRAHINRNGEKPYRGFVFRYAKTIPEILEGLKKRVKSTFTPLSRRKAIPIKVENTETGEVTEWESTKKFANHVGASLNTVQKAIGRKGRWNKYKITYIQCPLSQ